MKIKKAVIKHGDLIEDLIKAKSEYLKEKAEKKKIRIDAKAEKDKKQVDKQLKIDISKATAEFSRLKPQPKEAK